MDLQEISSIISATGYEPRRRELLALTAALSQKGGGLRSILLEGPPGSGKTAFGEAVARALKIPLVFAQLHAWTDADELFTGVDVAAAVAGDPDRVRQDGVLALAARRSNEEGCVVLLDEIDKTSERAEMLLLDWLQSGRVPIAPGRHLETFATRALVIFTSNGIRELGDAFMRRVRRVRMDPLPVERINALAAERSDVPIGIVKILSKAARAIASEDDAVLSLQELSLLCRDVMSLAENVTDIRELLAQLAARGPSGHKAALRSPHASAIWGELCRARAEPKIATLGDVC